MDFERDVYENAQEVTSSELLTGRVPPVRPVRILYTDQGSYQLAANALGIMTDFKVSFLSHVQSL